MYKRKARHRIAIAWVLLLSLMPFFVVKATHHHTMEYVASHTADGHSHSSQDDCPICHFFLSPFIEAQSLELQITDIYYRPLLVCYTDKEAYTPVYSYQLRAPPFSYSSL